MEHFFPVLLVLMATMLTLPVHSQEEHNLESLASRIKQLENQHNQTQVVTSTQSDIDRLQQQIHQLKHSILNSRVSALQKESNSDPILLQNDINHLRSDTRDDIRQLKIDIQSIKNNSSQQFHTFQDSLDALNTTFRAPVNIYKDCRQDTQRCFLQHVANNVWHRCHTPSLPLNITGYYTLDKRCEYESTNSGYFDASILAQSSTSVYCKCQVIYPYSSSLHGVTTSLRGDCTLVITRCPMSQTVHN